MHAIIWDFDGTLGYRSGGAWTASLWEVLQAEEPGCQVTQEQLRPYMVSGFPWHEPEQPHTHIKTADAWWQMCELIIQKAYLGVGFDSERARHLAGKFRETYLNLGRWRIYDDVIPVLESLSTAGWTHLILSNHVPELVDIISHLGLMSYIERVFNSAETGFEKPHRRSYQIVLETVPDVQSVWMVGDNVEADVAGAVRAGIPAILVRNYSAHARYYAETLYDVPDFISD
jgi:putative hydrolase of the HAD superfamily